MKKFNFILFIIIGLIAFISCDLKSKQEHVKEPSSSSLWTKEQANSWYLKQGWLVGSNYNPASAINQLEMWQADDFDGESIEKELGWARELGMNTMRVYLHDLLWEQDSTGLLERMDTFLDIASSHDIRPLFVFFDSCWDPFPSTGKQRDPRPHVHNSGWVQSPGYYALEDKSQYPRLEKYVKGVVKRFAKDERILGWDIWNEPDNDTGNSYRAVDLPQKEKYVLPLLDKAFGWARSQNPIQPLTSGLWVGDWSSHESLTDLQRLQVEQSDIITFHNYDDPLEFEKRIKWLLRYERPLLCTEYMARPNGSTFEGFLKIAKKYNIGMYNWGFVDGKTQTKYPWDSWVKEYTDEPELWFHEILREDGSPYKQEEVELIKKMTASESAL
ncbi:endo-beta-mannanase [Belliella baltica DSM 15883]|uniref:Endo-beta-mannanase n=1 Tax=Belliella baltica (strain DSM 15883 / CIP 108006 / LMG 21964 / BA134) TaxID=866536 RepID=I3Z982_BELBD|nr:cellulase family glycosylhydrolase [Belliella baltica]AFL85800.1 endo-beta-mannanase [Belliella baltica DSM 15883]